MTITHFQEWREDAPINWPLCGMRAPGDLISTFGECVDCPVCREIRTGARPIPPPTWNQPAAPPVTGDDLAPAESAAPPLDTVAADAPDPAPAPLSVQALMRIGAILPEGRTPSHAIDQQLADQRAGYAHYDRKDLIEELLRRDETAIRQGQEAADGRLQGRLIREFLRGVLSTIDHASLTRLDRDSSKAGAVERLLIALGAEPAPLQELKRHGTTLGSLDTRPAEDAIESPLVPQMPSREAAEAIRERQADKPKATMRVSAVRCSRCGEAVNLAGIGHLEGCPQVDMIPPLAVDDQLAMGD